MNEAERIETFKLELKKLIGAAEMPVSVLYYVLKEQYKEIKEIAKAYEENFVKNHS